MNKNLLIAATAAIFLVLIGIEGPSRSAQADTSAPAPIVSSGSNTSLNWAGYESTGGTYTGVGATWTVPATGGSTVSGDATWVGIGGMNGRDLIQAGTDAVNEGNGKVTYEAWYELLPRALTPVSLTVNPGDSITASIAQPTTGQWTISLKDNTTGQSYQTSVAYNSSLSSAEWIEEMPVVGRGFISLDQFGTVQFTSAWTIENGTQVSLTGSNAQQMTMINSQRQALAQPSTINSDGASFSVARTTAPATQSVVGARGGYGRTGIGVNGYQPHRQSFRGHGRTYVMNWGGGTYIIRFAFPF